MWLYYLCTVGGLMLLVGSMFLIFKGKILIDKETKEVVSVELPWLGKLQTHTPALVLFLMGAGLVIYPLHLISSQPQVVIQGAVGAASQEEMQVYAALGPDVIEHGKTTFTLRAPFSTSVTEYQVLYIARGQIISHQVFKMPKSPGAAVNMSAEGGRAVEIQ